MTKMTGRKIDFPHDKDKDKENHSGAKGLHCCLIAALLASRNSSPQDKSPIKAAAFHHRRRPHTLTPLPLSGILKSI